MIISSLSLFNIRNLRNGTFRFADGTNVFIGKNGQGKTGLIEAIHVLSFTKSFRTANFSELITLGLDAGSIFGSITSLRGDTSLGVVFENDTRDFFVNGNKARSATDYIGKFLCVTFSPTDLSLVQGGPAERRRFLDKHIIDLDSGMTQVFADYSRALRSKQEILKSGKASLEQIEPWNVILAERGARIYSARGALVQELEPRAQNFHRRFAASDNELRMQIDTAIVCDDVRSEVALKTSIEQQLAAFADREIRSQRALVGPHRDDLKLVLNDRDARKFASQGQARSVVLACKLAILKLLRERTGDAPVTLLDDVDSELDRQRGDDFYRALFEFSSQIFITTTDAHQRQLTTDSPITYWQISAGEIVESSGIS